MRMIERLKQRWRTYKRDRWLRKCARRRERDAEIFRLYISAYRRMGVTPSQADLETREMVERLVAEEDKRSKREQGIRVRFWAGRTPPKEYFEPVDPYRNRDTTCLPTVNHLALSRYLKETGKRGHELSREEISRFVSTDQPSCDNEKR